MNDVYLITGSNMGRKKDNLLKAEALLEEHCGTIIDRSALYETAPWGNPDQQPFLNRALMLRTPLNAADLISRILQVEEQMGRRRGEKFGPRIIDIDIIFYNHQVIHSPQLKVPHPELVHRRFVLQPLNDIIPAYIHPVLYKTVSELLQACEDPLEVKKCEA